MVNGKTPMFLTLLLMAVLVAAVLTFQPYSADSPGRAFTKPARSYIRAAIKQDSVGLRRISTSMLPVMWALSVARAHPDTLALWGRWIRAWTGEKQGDTTEVFVYPGGDVCSKEPIVLRIVDSGNQARIAGVRSACFDPT
jgi:hypothetical protein